ncbi:MAG: Gfo/Idh/MocA family oxidoreductase [Armatimonadota bacterium]
MLSDYQNGEGKLRFPSNSDAYEFKETNMAETIRWGILGPGNIARKMAAALSSLPEAQLTAVGSRDIQKAEAFGNDFNIPNRYGSYEELAADPNVDIIYVATPHTFHKDNTLLALNGGKAVLCEKPFAVNAKDAREMVKTARAKNLFLMEAMWSRFLPNLQTCRQALEAGKIGKIRMLQAHFGFRAGWDTEGRLLNPKLAGGGLLDVGVYTLSFASRILGTPTQISSLAHIGKTGVDEQCAVLLGYKGGELAILSSAVRTTTPHEAIIMGEDGMIRMPNFWNGSTVIVRSGEEEEIIESKIEGNGFEYQAQECMNCIKAGKTESSVLPLDETLSIMTTMDEIRGQWGLKYPME